MYILQKATHSGYVRNDAALSETLPILAVHSGSSGKLQIRRFQPPH